MEARAVIVLVLLMVLMHGGADGPELLQEDEPPRMTSSFSTLMLPMSNEEVGCGVEVSAKK